MTADRAANAMAWRRLIERLLPFADSATRELPLGRLLRLSLFQISAGMVAVLLTGTLNRVMIVELGVSGVLVSLMVCLPLVFAPLRALIGFRSDTHRSVLGWRRGPYIWFGSMLQFGGLAIMPFALLILSGDTHGPVVVGHGAALVAFLLVGAGMHTAQTAGLALATDLAPADARPRVVALLYLMLLVGMLVSAIVLGGLLAEFSAVRLIQVIQGAAVVTLVLNVAAMWKQEARNPALTSQPLSTEARDFSAQWRDFVGGGRASRLLVAVGLGAAAFGMQDVLLEPYGAQVLQLGVGQTTALTALWAGGMIAGFARAAHDLTRGGEPHRIAGYGAVAGAAAFATVIFSGAVQSTPLFCIGVAGIGFGGGLFAVGTLTAAMALAREGRSGLALGAWGAVHATASGIAIAVGGGLRDVVAALTETGRFGAAFSGPFTAYSFVYHIEIFLLFAMLVAIGPLARHAPSDDRRAQSRFGLADFPT
ncbi:MAG: BCD family MFS transporter [Hyphomonadaceae bacterium]|nr:BCD family MFS transporter [Hyphomonadaceae bacterium]